MFGTRTLLPTVTAETISAALRGDPAEDAAEASRLLRMEQPVLYAQLHGYSRSLPGPWAAAYMGGALVTLFLLRCQAEHDLTGGLA